MTSFVLELIRDHRHLLKLFRSSTHHHYHSIRREVSRDLAPFNYEVEDTIPNIVKVFSVSHYQVFPC
jgi:hypothetical protein